MTGLPLAEVTTTFNCPFCGRPLELVEWEREVCVACWACLRAACFTVWRAWRYFAGRHLDWRRLLGDLYGAYCAEGTA